MRPLVDVRDEGATPIEPGVPVNITKTGYFLFLLGQC